MAVVTFGSIWSGVTPPDDTTTSTSSWEALNSSTASSIAFFAVSTWPCHSST